jgi:hypothetical protein
MQESHLEKAKSEGGRMKEAIICMLIVVALLGWVGRYEYQEQLEREQRRSAMLESQRRADWRVIRLLTPHLRNGVACWNSKDMSAWDILDALENRLEGKAVMISKEER